ncbi:MAG TPA: DUF1579 domain-containing protein [Tepidisphaeraceae bacterium]|nr:DUF1579 domain-containing protein [Tepidisphaeraceae bacterium]
MKVEPQKEHRWLQKFVGDWVMEDAKAEGPGGDKPHPKWVETVRSLHGVWVVAEGRGEMPDGGGPATTMMTLGFDPRVGHFVGTWLGSMMTHLWVYSGTLDPSGRVLSLDAEGPDFADLAKPNRKYKDVHEFRGDDHRVLTSHLLGDDGKWTQFMTAHYRRK